MIAEHATRADIPPVELELAALVPGADNPRRAVDDASMAGLIESIKANGIIQPLVVRPLDGARGAPVRYEIIAGHRRYAAARGAGLQVVPVRVLAGAGDAQVHVMRLVENLQRAGLDPIEQAEGLERLKLQDDLSDAAIGALIGKSGAWVSRTRMLLALPRVVQDALQAHRLSTSHGWELQRYRAFPALVERLSLVAQRDGLGAAALGVPFPAADELERSGLIVPLDEPPPGFDGAMCAACPWKARFAAGPEDLGYCAKPAHFRQLVADARRRLVGDATPIGPPPAIAWRSPAAAQRIPAGKLLPKAIASVDRLLGRLSPAEAQASGLPLLVRQHRGVLDRVFGPAPILQDDGMEEE